MYYDHKRERVLLRDGRSVVTPFKFARAVLLDEDTGHLSVAESFDSRNYDFHFKDTTTSEIGEVEVEPSDHGHTDEDMDRLINRIYQSERYEDTQAANDRIFEEIEFFDRTRNITFLLKCAEMIDRFKEDKVVWGVGRGSSCASYILFLLEVNDVDPIRFDIPFKELTKELD